MPFTGSHPAAVLLLLRTPLPASALVIGSMAPDTPYFVPFGMGPTHRPISVFTSDVLIGLALWAAWHGWVSAPAVAAAPAALRRRLAGRVELGLLRRLDRKLPLAPVALAVGAETHVLWDEFTHPGRFGSRHIAFLAGSWAGVPGTQWAQYLSGVLGITALGLAAAHWWQRHPPAGLLPTPPPTPRPAAPPSRSPNPLPGLPPGLGRRTAQLSWASVALVGMVVAVPAALDATSPRGAAFNAVTHGVGAGAVTALLLAGVWRVFSGWRPG